MGRELGGKHMVGQSERRPLWKEAKLAAASQAPLLSYTLLFLEFSPASGEVLCEIPFGLIWAQGIHRKEFV